MREILSRHQKVLEAMTLLGNHKKCGRFDLLFQMLKDADSVVLQISCIQFSNAIVSHPDELDFRLHLRNEILRSGLRELWPVSGE